MSKVKAMTLRQKLRADAEKQLAGLREQMNEAAQKVTADLEINPYDLMRLCCTGQTKTVKAQLITDLANHKERQLEKLYNDQMGMFDADEEK